jgi:hypothetical protein
MKVVARSNVASRSSAFAGARVATRNAPKAAAPRAAVRTMALFGGAKTAVPSSIYDIAVTNIDGKQIKMSQYKGKALLIVNVASGKKMQTNFIFHFSSYRHRGH